MHAKKIDLSDPFNYHDDKIARVKIPLEGKKFSARVLAFATKKENE